MSRYRTELYIKANESLYLNHHSKVLMIGSCFSNHIGEKLMKNKFEIRLNPYGITFNPASIVLQLTEIVQLKTYSNMDLKKIDQLYFSLNHHSSFSSLDNLSLLKKINSSISEANQFILNSNTIIITFGSAWVYEDASNNKIVNNCHKLPSTNFKKRLLSIEEITETYNNCINNLLKTNSELNFIFTVSPVRHIKEGFVDNQRSKSILIESIHQIIDKNKNCSYFPAYEIMMDDLRDYRFYNDDMIHPSDLAIRYIWEKFCECYFNTNTLRLIQEIESINKSIAHKPFQKESENYKLFLKNNLEKINSLEDYVKEKFKKEIEDISNSTL